MSLVETLLSCNSIILVCGSGGVGKTTLSAALALKACHLGRKTLVMTIDPAKRLAAAMGLSDITSHPQHVATKGEGILDALMLDVKETFDAIVKKYAPNLDTMTSILTNPLYRHLSTMISGSQEYMAMEKLFEMAQSRQYDLLILDTPPSQNAHDFLKAPSRMTQALTNSMLKLFFTPASDTGGWARRFIQKSSQSLMTIMGRVAGSEVIDEIRDFMFSTISLLDGFQHRADDVLALLRRKGTEAVIVSNSDPATYQDAIQLAKELKREKILAQGMIINRLYPKIFTGSRLEELCKKQLATHPDDPRLQPLATALFYHHLYQRDRVSLRAITRALPKKMWLGTLENTFADIHELPELLKLVEKL